MTDRPRTAHTDDDTGTGPASPGSPPRMPRWVKVSAIVVAVLIVLFAVALLTGLGGDHGPGRHEPGQQQEQGHDPSKWNHQ
ncbi:hypothetical protein [Actinomadura sp. SCN-SB]|uniref:hypothetical protein n=1 Tax=Actinomadura sp. SCN-SB TaxID=3373092 RepID=UPI003750E0DE